MNSKNLTKAELAHMRRVKELPCGVCGFSTPSQAHHIKQGLHYLTIPLCPTCHTAPHSGIHGLKRMWQVTKKDELSVLNDTIKKLIK